MISTIVSTYYANIYVGCRPGYGEDSDKMKQKVLDEAQILMAFNAIQEFCNTVKLGVTITRTKFVYVDGSEPGLIIGLINYPRFPKEPKEILDTAIDLATRLKELLGQERLSIVTPYETILLGEK